MSERKYEWSGSVSGRVVWNCAYPNVLDTRVDRIQVNRHCLVLFTTYPTGARIAHSSTNTTDTAGSHRSHWQWSCYRSRSWSCSCFYPSLSGGTNYGNSAESQEMLSSSNSQPVIPEGERNSKPGPEASPVPTSWDYSVDVDTRDTTPWCLIENSLKLCETTTNWSTCGDQATKNFLRGCWVFIAPSSLGHGQHGRLRFFLFLLLSDTRGGRSLGLRMLAANRQSLHWCNRNSHAKGPFNFHNP